MDRLSGDPWDRHNNPSQFGNLSTSERLLLVDWIKDRLVHSDSDSSSHTHIGPSSSYGLKHLAGRELGFYISNGAFKGAMLECGFVPEDEEHLNWQFRYEERMEDGVELGNTVKELRKSAGLTQSELGRMVGYSNGWVSSLERGRVSRVSRETVGKFEKFFQVSLRHFSQLF